MAARQRRSVIITCAITGSIHTPSMSPYLPVTPQEIADAAVGAAEAGAAIVHLHARDPVDGHPTQDPQYFRDLRGRHRPAQRRRDQFHDRWRGDDDHRGASAAGAAAQARGRVAQHGIDELRALPDAQALLDVQIRLGAQLPRNVRRARVQEHVQGYRIHPDLVRRQRHAVRDRVLRHRASVHGGAFFRSRHRQAAVCSSRACSGYSAASARTRTMSRT